MRKSSPPSYRSGRALCREVAIALRGHAGAFRSRGPGAVFERVTGAFRGYHIAAYARETQPGSGVYTACYKVCDGRPHDYWRAHCLFKGATHGDFATAPAALVAADQLAHLAIGNLPTLNQLRGCSAALLFRFIGLDQWPRQSSA